MKWLIRWLDKREAESRKRKHQRGYDFAAGHLLKGKPVSELETLLHNPFDPDEFEDGIHEAIQDFFKTQAHLLQHVK